MTRFKAFFQKKENLLLLGVILFAFAIRLYFFLKTYNQALWWDEADYMSIAKHYGLGTPEIAAPWRARGMGVLLGIFYFFGATEIFQRVVVIGFSLAAVFLTYLVGKEMYNRNVGLVAAVFMAVYAEHLFWSMRFSGEVLGLVFFMLGALFFWKGYVQKKSKWFMVASGALIGYGIFVYESVGPIFVFLAIYLIATERFAFLKNMRFWYGVIGLLLVLIPVFWHYYDLYGQIYPRISHVIEGSLAPGTELSQKVEGQGTFSVILTAFTFFRNMNAYMLWPLLVLLLIGLLSYVDMILGFDIVVKDKESPLRKDFFVFWWALCILVLFGLYLAVTNAYFEPRYIFPAMPALFIISARGVWTVFDYVSKYKKTVAVAVLILMLLLVSYSHITYAKNIINAKKTTFSQERPAGEWLKQNTKPGDILLACDQVVPFVYYSERDVITYRYNTTEIDEQIRQLKSPYLVIDGYHWDCNVNYVNERQENLTPVQIYSEGQSPVVVIFQTKGYW